MLILKAEGEGFNSNKYDLRTLELLITNYRLIIDKTLPPILGYKTFATSLKSSLDYEVELRPGCLEVAVDIISHLDKDYLTGLLFDGGNTLSYAISKLFADAIGLRRKAAELMEQGIPNINFTVIIGDNNTVHQENQQGQIPIKEPKAIPVADLTRAPVNRLIDGIDGQKLESVSLRSSDGAADAGVTFTSADRRIVGTELESLPDYIEIVGHLFDVNYVACHGAIKSGTQRFSVSWDEGLRPKIRECADRKGILFMAKPVFDRNKLNRDPVSFHIIDCSVIQRDLLKH